MHLAFVFTNQQLQAHFDDKLFLELGIEKMYPFFKWISYLFKYDIYIKTCHVVQHYTATAEQTKRYLIHVFHVSRRVKTETTRP